jgi:hypothetical protein
MVLEALLFPGLLLEVTPLVPAPPLTPAGPLPVEAGALPLELSLPATVLALPPPQPASTTRSRPAERTFRIGTLLAPLPGRSTPRLGNAINSKIVNASASQALTTG